MAKFYSTKTYGTDRGLSCCFRQWKADHSHCSTLHGYSLGIKLIFESDTLDSRNWVMDFGGLKQFKDWADYMFDHTLVISRDDPHLETFLLLDGITGGYQDRGVCDLRIVEGVGCEMFAKMCYEAMNDILYNMLHLDNSRYPLSEAVRLKSAEVFEHAGNSAIYEGDNE
jgi:6-pyruvoyltetrahydropterin/6-carboxytetrahydropterin synthase